MSVTEMKKFIIEKVDNLNETQLIRLSQFVENIDKTPTKEYDLLQQINEIVSEREEVLKKLAK